MRSIPNSRGVTWKAPRHGGWPDEKAPRQFAVFRMGDLEHAQGAGYTNRLAPGDGVEEVHRCVGVGEKVVGLNRRGSGLAPVIGLHIGGRAVGGSKALRTWGSPLILVTMTYDSITAVVLGLHEASRERCC